jgi:hypothetical protein
VGGFGGGFALGRANEAGRPTTRTARLPLPTPLPGVRRTVPALAPLAPVPPLAPAPQPQSQSQSQSQRQTTQQTTTRPTTTKRIEE